MNIIEDKIRKSEAEEKDDDTTEEHIFSSYDVVIRYYRCRL